MIDAHAGTLAVLGELGDGALGRAAALIADASSCIMPLRTAPASAAVLRLGAGRRAAPSSRSFMPKRRGARLTSRPRAAPCCRGGDPRRGGGGAAWLGAPRRAPWPRR
jgi:hypothetical protein